MQAALHHAEEVDGQKVIELKLDHKPEDDI